MLAVHADDPFSFPVEASPDETPFDGSAGTASDLLVIVSFCYCGRIYAE